MVTIFLHVQYKDCALSKYVSSGGFSLGMLKYVVKPGQEGPKGFKNLDIHLFSIFILLKVVMIYPPLCVSIVIAMEINGVRTGKIIFIVSTCSVHILLDYPLPINLVRMMQGQLGCHSHLSAETNPLCNQERIGITKAGFFCNAGW
jgi:hypothetical protein